MSRFRMRTARVSVVGLAAGALILTGCSSGGGGDAGDVSKDDAAKQQVRYDFGDAAASKGPAEPVKGAKKGGDLTVYQRDSYAHLDPAQMYVSDEGTMSTLIHRRLTSYKRDSAGKYTVVGDLATDSGQASKDQRTWKYTLKDGIKWEDGSPITSKDIRHTFERQFAPFISEGPVFIQQWMAGKSGTGYRKLLPDGPYKGDHLPDKVLETPDDKTVIFHFKDPQPDLPYALGMAGYAAVQEKGDTKEKYDKKPVSSGPYKIASFKSGKSMKLVRNEEWDAKTDPVRHAYPDAHNIQFGVSYEASTKRLVSDSAENQTAVSYTNQVDASSMQSVRSDPKVKDRSLSGYQPYVGKISLNMDRLKDKKVREAIAHALPAQSLVQAFGGSGGGELAGNYLSPTVAGHTESDPYGKVENPQGDVKKAKRILKEAGKTGQKLTFAFQNSPEWQDYSIAAKDNLTKAGFDVQLKDIVADTYYDQIGKVKNKYDMYHSSWGADWPSAGTVIPPTLDGRQVQDGASNYSHYNNPEMNKEMDRISKIKDPDTAAKEWGKLADKILKEDLPDVPLMYYKQIQLYGSKVGGAVNNAVISSIDPTQLYVKK
ncbi:ABC transporter [Streptomyces abyssalis]|uniref:ABC transporter n=1 Tax=Streptomyces abyssalis TaxID=933944 RepID=A0A1E7JG81_9ACTN|nr:ABC transporter substrate-binding protein [Streptomyces abyssalis]OEU85479.1 ABC transporter [Streptomyces abyssalis]OEU93058.1 ABC transporter [Streptomyces abyssalis]OEV27336.1 ABC transporter [Streptomyces nanshensis]